ncbi:hypothetical protein ACFU6F_28015, partial [Streptomyces sp. NPDC057460]
MRLAERCGLPALADEFVRLPRSKYGTGAFSAGKLMSLVGSMVVGADSIDDMDRLRHGAMGRLFTGVRTPSTIGSGLGGVSPRGKGGKGGEVVLSVFPLFFFSPAAP